MRIVCIIKIKLFIIILMLKNEKNLKKFKKLCKIS